MSDTPPKPQAEDPRQARKRLGVIFLHHLVDEVTRNNLASFRRWNPETPIVTVSSGEALEGGCTVLAWPKMAYRWKTHTSRGGLHIRSADLLLYAWYVNRLEHCDRWLIVEWDAYCAMPVEEFDAPVSRFPCVAASIRTLEREPEWCWFQSVNTLPEHLRPSAMGIVPFCFILVSDELLSRICSAAPWDALGRSNCELRFATLCNAAGSPPVAHPLGGANIGWRAIPKNKILSRNMWHPVKWLVQNR